MKNDQVKIFPSGGMPGRVHVFGPGCSLSTGDRTPFLLDYSGRVTAAACYRARGRS